MDERPVFVLLVVVGIAVGCTNARLSLSLPLYNTVLAIPIPVIAVRRHVFVAAGTGGTRAQRVVEPWMDGWTQESKPRTGNEAACSTRAGHVCVDRLRAGAPLFRVFRPVTGRVRGRTGGGDRGHVEIGVFGNLRALRRNQRGRGAGSFS
ncbi:hypothetical protein FA13DRAFT_99409 [Coprinellus micaceus]|uniref:Uncharacterized protein n=1 Tax=Coprinellus micaceus TaxID=71717 RepID=A0A4Y7SI22_COPMI|nr:hypothetical protein FA13DRAFT_99409 [Coprinellus micaceus]